MIVAALMTLLIWFVILLLWSVIKADKTSKKDVDLGLFAYVENAHQAGIEKSNRKNKIA